MALNQNRMMPPATLGGLGATYGCLGVARNPVFLTVVKIYGSSLESGYS